MRAAPTRTEILALIARFELIVARLGEEEDWQLLAAKTIAGLQELLALREKGCAGPAPHGGGATVGVWRATWSFRWKG